MFSSNQGPVFLNFQCSGGKGRGDCRNIQFPSLFSFFRWLSARITVEKESSGRKARSDLIDLGEYFLKLLLLAGILGFLIDRSSTAK